MEPTWVNANILCKGNDNPLLSLSRQARDKIICFRGYQRIYSWVSANTSSISGQVKSFQRQIGKDPGPSSSYVLEGMVLEQLIRGELLVWTLFILKMFKYLP